MKTHIQQPWTAGEIVRTMLICGFIGSITILAIGLTGIKYAVTGIMKVIE